MNDGMTRQLKTSFVTKFLHSYFTLSPKSLPPSHYWLILRWSCISQFPSIFFLLLLLGPERDAKYCADHVCTSICPLTYLRNHMANMAKLRQYLCMLTVAMA